LTEVLFLNKLRQGQLWAWSVADDFWRVASGKLSSAANHFLLLCADNKSKCLLVSVKSKKWSQSCRRLYIVTIVKCWLIRNYPVKRWDVNNLSLELHMSNDYFQSCRRK